MSTPQDKIPSESNLPTLGMLVKLLMEVPRRMSGKLGKDEPGGSPETAIDLPPMMASDADARRYGFDQNLSTAWQQVVDSPFTQDTIASIVGQLPTFGMARDPKPRGGESATAFVPHLNPTRAFLNEIPFYQDPNKMPGILLHESVHTRHLQQDPEFIELARSLEPEYNALVDRYIAEPNRQHNITQFAVENQGEHMAYAIQLATDWLRNKEPQERLDMYEQWVPGTKKAVEFVQKKLKK